jgi:hypothetical protein
MITSKRELSNRRPNEPNTNVLGDEKATERSNGIEKAVKAAKER